MNKVEVIMKPSLRFETSTFTVSGLGPQTSTPDLLSGTNIQNKTNFYLGEEDEIYEGYGKLSTSYPYRHYACYDRVLKTAERKTAVLENDFLKATFLPELGGRLWELIDKTTGENLLYTNDVIRPGNLAVRNAWVSGGVEWNISMIGHTPFTMELLFTAKLEREDGTPVLRMYEYERVRRVTYQMDFWLGGEDRFLNCRMRIFNQTDKVVPMYWWSNMAVPEYQGGRVIVPADEAYTNRADGVYKVSVPLVDGNDISRYEQIPNQVDYFFHIRKEAPKYIANINHTGYGLLHLSTSRLLSRKLFSWGNNEASDNWQRFLTEHAGRYVEIQAGLGKTQYGCIPMAPHTAWEWLELYGPVQASENAAACPYDAALKEMDEIVSQHLQTLVPEKTLADTKPLAKKAGTLIYSGSGYGAFENELRLHMGEAALSPQLDFGSLSPSYKEWCEFLHSGLFPLPAPEEAPSDFIAEPVLFEALVNTIETKNKDNWYAHYQLGLCYLTIQKDAAKAEKHFSRSSQLCPNPWALHALSVLRLSEGNKTQAARHISDGYRMRPSDLTYLKETFKILLLSEAYGELLDIYAGLSDDFRNESRIHFDSLIALARTGHEKEILDYLNQNRIVLDDLRECEDSLGDLWMEVNEKVNKVSEKVPSVYNYNSL